MYFVSSLVIWTLTILLSILQIFAKYDLSNSMLEAHNKLRKKHHSPPLKHDPELSDECVKYAEIIAYKEELKYSGSKYGENLYVTRGTPLSSVFGWYSEQSHYHYNKPGLHNKTRHFTQMVWKKSETFGAGTFKGKNGKNYVVARYSPKGNVIGEFRNNVLQPNRSYQSLNSIYCLVLTLLMPVLW